MFIYHIRPFRLPILSDEQVCCFTNNPDNMNPIGDIGVGVLLSSHIGSILGFHWQYWYWQYLGDTLGQYWLAIRTCDIGFIIGTQ